MRCLNGFTETGGIKHSKRPLSPLDALPGSPGPNMQWAQLSASLAYVTDPLTQASGYVFDLESSLLSL